MPTYTSTTINGLATNTPIEGATTPAEINNSIREIKVALKNSISDDGTDFKIGTNFGVNRSTGVATLPSMAIKSIDCASTATASIFDGNLTGDVTGNVTGDLTGNILGSGFIGMVAPFACTNAPTGWLACNGSAVSRTTYANLFAVIGTIWGAGNGTTTFNLPDLDGEFIRGASGTRAVASVEVEQTKLVSHTHTNSVGIQSANHHHDDAGHAHSYLMTGVPSGYVNGVPFWSQPDTPVYQSTNAGYANLGNETANHNHTVTINSAGNSDETRPRNIALLYCIKAT